MRSRFWLSIAMLLWAVASRPAQADITADYYVWGTIGPTMKVQVADNGHARVEMGGHLVAIRRDGITYLVHTDEQGAFVVTADEFARIEASLTPNEPFAAESDMVRGARIVEAGTEMVGGRTGRILLVQGEGDQAQSPEFAFVVSDDADLRPVGSVIAMIFGTPGAMPMASPVRGLIEQIHARGTLIRMWSLLRLTGTSSEPIPAAAFDLPGPILTGDEAYARLGRAW